VIDYICHVYCGYPYWPLVPQVI